MDKYLYAVCSVTLDEMQNGDTPELTGKPVTFFINAQEASNNALKRQHEQNTPLTYTPIGPNQVLIGTPHITMVFRCSLSDEQISKMTETAQPFSAGSWSGKIDKGTICDVQSWMSRDFLHPKDVFSDEWVPQNSVPSHAKMCAEAYNRNMAYDDFWKSIKKTTPQVLSSFNIQDPAIQRACEDAFGAHGFMKKPLDELPMEQAYCQQFMRLMTHDQPLDVAVKTDSFHQYFNSRLDEIAAINPTISTPQLVTEAMEQTVSQFQQFANMSHNLHEQLLFNQLAMMNTICGQSLDKVVAEQQPDFVNIFVNKIQNTQDSMDSAVLDRLSQEASDSVQTVGDAAHDHVGEYLLNL